MLSYIINNMSFSSLCMMVVERLKRIDNFSYAVIVVADLQYYDKIIPRSRLNLPYSSQINVTKRIKVVLVESYDDLSQVLYQILDETNNREDQFSNDKTCVLSLYGVFEHFAQQISSKTILDKEENCEYSMVQNHFTAHSVNYVCFLLNKIYQLNGCEVLACGPDSRNVFISTVPYTEIHPSNIDKSEYISFEKEDSNTNSRVESTSLDTRGVRLKTILSKWSIFNEISSSDCYLK